METDNFSYCDDDDDVIMENVILESLNDFNEQQYNALTNESENLYNSPIINNNVYYTVNGEEFQFNSENNQNISNTNEQQSDDKSREKLLITANTMSRIEKAELELKETLDLYLHLHNKMEQLYNEYINVKKEYENLEEQRNQSANVFNDHSAIIEHQNILYERGLLQDKYNIDIIPNSSEKPEEIQEEKDIDLLFQYNESLGVKTELRFIFPDGKKADFYTGSKQTLDIVTKFASKQYGRELIIVGLITEKENVKNVTLEDIGLCYKAVIRFRVVV